ncbi:MAG TPA: diacylglycerol kinase family protein [Solirubrobacterales bacterium]|nr:diacylglycerol kinase family protein [Solirubrobacterales bacterium]
MSRRLGAIAAILGGAAALALALYVFVADFPRGLVVVACVVVALAAAWYALLRRGLRRLLGTAAAIGLLATGAVLVAGGENALALLLVAATFALSLAGARFAFRPERSLPRAVAPRRPVLFVNPRSGDGKAAEVDLVGEAERRGIEAVELSPGDDLEELVRAAVSEGADGLAMAGGDGSQALVAAIAAEHDLPYACVPSGTRNHFALDLGVDRADVVGALDAFVDGGERYVDLGEVNGRVFVNNVSLGVYAQAVGQDDYREAKLRTLLQTLTETLGPEGEPVQLRWHDPEGAEQASTALILVSNNAYRLGPTLGSGTRPRLDAGVLGIVDFHPPIAGEPDDQARWRQLEAGELEIECEQRIPVGIDGESVTLESPLRFRVRPKALRVRIAHEHPGASPSAEIPEGALSALKQLLRIAGRGA